MSQTVLYARVSTVDQPIAYQRTQAEAMGFRVDEVVTDAGVLGLDFDPTEWSERQYTSGSDTDTDQNAEGSGKSSGDGSGIFHRPWKKKL